MIDRPVAFCRRPLRHTGEEIVQERQAKRISGAVGDPTEGRSPDPPEVWGRHIESSGFRREAMRLKSQRITTQL